MTRTIIIQGDDPRVAALAERLGRMALRGGPTDAELGFVAFDGPSLPYGAVIAIVRASRERGCAISRGRVEYAWEHGVRDLAGWPLCEPFLNGVKL